MEIKSTLKMRSYGVLNVVYKDIDSTDELNNKNIQGVHAYCFYGDKLVVVYAEKKGYWTPPGGGVEKRETVEEAVSREVLEETNMKVIKQQIIGYQEIFEPNGPIIQTRSICLVEPVGEFISDPDGDITEIKLIDPADYKKYFNWGEIGDRLMQRALALKAGLMDVK